MAQMQTPNLCGVGRLTYGALAMTYFLTGNPQYHRRGVISRSCSGWEGVGPTRYGRQEFWDEVKVVSLGTLGCALHRGGGSLGPRLHGDDTHGRTLYWQQGYRVKPHGQLVLVRSRHCCPYTPSLSTSWSRTTLQGCLAPGRSHLQQVSRLDAFNGYRYRI